MANQVGPERGFNRDENAVTLLWQNQSKHFPLTSKQKLARQLIAEIGKIYRGNKHE